MRRLTMLIIMFFMAFPVLYATGDTDSGEQDFLLFYSNDIIGETEPCG